MGDNKQTIRLEIMNTVADIYYILQYRNGGYFRSFSTVMGNVLDPSV
jgi:hypothetical protein